MKIEITTSVRTLERINAILGMVIYEIENGTNSEAMKEHFDLKRKDDLKTLEIFRKQLINNHPIIKK
jgi:hypothetical protein